MTSQPRAVVLLSGGLDSATCLAIAQSQGFAAYALSVRYGQRHSVENEAAQRIAAKIGAADFREIAIDLRSIGGSALTGSLEVPKGRSAEAMEQDIPVTYVPARNTVFLSCALGWAEVLGASDLFIGVNALDYSGYPDCRPAFIEAFERLANVATKAGVEGRPFRIQAPLLHWTKAQIIREGLRLGVPYELTHSCYDPVGPEGLACGQCDSCQLRLKGFAEAGSTDPVRYVLQPS